MPSAERKRRGSIRWSASAWRTACATTRRSFPAVSSNALRWRERCRIAFHPAGRRAYGKPDSRNGEAVMELLQSCIAKVQPSAW